jgi:hypothetical protein
MNCNQCVHKRSNIGTHHIACAVIGDKIIDNGNIHIARLMGGDPLFTVTLIGEIPSLSVLLEINPHGFKKGWANWPLNFDPIWIDTCLLFKDKG